MEDRGSEGERKGVRVNKSESVTKRYNKPRPVPFLCVLPLSSFCIPVPLPTWTYKRLLLCFYLLASGAALAVTGHCGWMCVRNASAWLYMSTKSNSTSVSACLHRMKPFVCPMFSVLTKSCSTDVWLNKDRKDGWNRIIEEKNVIK